MYFINDVEFNKSKPKNKGRVKKLINTAGKIGAYAATAGLAGTAGLSALTGTKWYRKKLAKKLNKKYTKNIPEITSLVLNKQKRTIDKAMDKSALLGAASLTGLIATSPRRKKTKTSFNPSVKYGKKRSK